MKKKMLIIGLSCMLGLSSCGQVENVERNSAVIEEGLQASQSSEKEEPAATAKETPEAPIASPVTTPQEEFAIDQERLIQEQTFDVTLEGWGAVQFVSYQPKAPESDVEFVLYQQGKEAYTLPDAWNTGATFLQVQAVAFKDYNEDGKTDIITICEYSDNYEEEIYNVSVVYFQTEQGFEIEPLHHEYLQKNQITSSIEEVMDSHEDYLDFVTSLSGGYKGVDAQIRLMVKAREQWLINDDYVNDVEKVTVADLDNNDRLELIVSHHGGTGHYTYSHFYEIAEDYKSLEKCKIDISEGESQPDILLETEDVAVYVDRQGIPHYIVADYIRNGSEYYFLWHDMTLQEGVVGYNPLGMRYEDYSYQADKAWVRYTDVNGKEITQEEFQAISETFFADSQTQYYVNWKWLNKKELHELSDEQLQNILLESLTIWQASTESIETSSVQRNIEETDSAWHLANWISIENPSWKEHYVAKGLVSDTLPYELKLLKKAKNNITDDEEWLERNELSLQSAAMDKEYTYQIGDYATLYLYKNGEPLADLDFVEYQYANEALNDEEKGWVTQEIRYVLVEDNILYVSSYHYTYAETEPLNAYITAVDLTNYEVLWKTAPLTCNSVNFEIVGDTIFCGYGFTSEEDYLYQLDKKTGEVLWREKVKSQPEYIIYKEDCLYVRTYDTDYVYQLSK